MCHRLHTACCTASRCTTHGSQQSPCSIGAGSVSHMYVHIMKPCGQTAWPHTSLQRAQPAGFQGRVGMSRLSEQPCKPQQRTATTGWVPPYGRMTAVSSNTIDHVHHSIVWQLQGPFTSPTTACGLSWLLCCVSKPRAAPHRTAHKPHEHDQARHTRSCDTCTPAECTLATTVCSS
jgi:hypothetical protein